MTIRAIVTAGFGNGTFNGTIAGIITRGYVAGAAVTTTNVSGRFRIDFPPEDRNIDFPFEDRTIDFPPESRKIKV